MAKLYFDPTLEVFASPALDVWCTAVLVLKMFSKSGGDLIEFQGIQTDDKNDDLLSRIAQSDFSFAQSIENTILRGYMSEKLTECLHINPNDRGTVEDLLSIVPKATSETAN
ncbi:Aste57867_17139 [Aphanomyces stellatus]|uniref:Aste57867_17139 protein n=1 Tax=Aphanomyces stellatus TaxID=120398 RepID=A0A485L8W7_9STRA|nr:hypothetical protein As57867_017080 [Aphanomyces stellatus]VFT93897.1 Aste57867_17139 [Aphanomyces stellatus]